MYEKVTWPSASGDEEFTYSRPPCINRCGNPVDSLKDCQPESQEEVVFRLLVLTFKKILTFLFHSPTHFAFWHAKSHHTWVWSESRSYLVKDEGGKDIFWIPTSAITCRACWSSKPHDQPVSNVLKSDLFFRSTSNIIGCWWKIRNIMQQTTFFPKYLNLFFCRKI